MDPNSDVAQVVQLAAAKGIDLAPFWWCAQMLRDHNPGDQADPTPELAKRVMWRLRVGHQLDVALRISVHELLHERPRHLV